MGRGTRERKDLLHFRAGLGVGVGIQTARGPDVGEEEVSAVDFRVYSEKYWGKRFSRWLISSVRTPTCG